MEEKGPVAKVLPAREPLGTFTARVEETGRLKLPVKIKEWLDKFPEKIFFCTSLDNRTGEIFPLSVWQVRHDQLDSAVDCEPAERTLRRAMRLGNEAEMDAMGRITLPSQLRTRLNITGPQELWLIVLKGSVQFQTQAIYEEENRDADADPVGDLKVLNKAGFGKGIR